MNELLKVNNCVVLQVFLQKRCKKQRNGIPSSLALSSVLDGVQTPQHDTKCHLEPDPTQPFQICLLSLCPYSVSQPNPIIDFPLTVSCIFKPLCSKPPVWQTPTYPSMSLLCPFHSQSLSQHSVQLSAILGNTLHCNCYFHVLTHD